jgi:hypothetical protein
MYGYAPPKNLILIPPNWFFMWYAESPRIVQDIPLLRYVLDFDGVLVRDREGTEVVRARFRVLGVASVSGLLGPVLMDSLPVKVRNYVQQQPQSH